MIKKVFFVTLGLIGLATAAAVYVVIKKPDAWITSSDITVNIAESPD